MKKFLFIAGLVSAFVAGLAGAQQQQNKIVIGTGATGGGFAAYGSSLSTVLSRNTNLNISTLQTTGSYENVALLRDRTNTGSNTYYCGLTTLDAAFASFNGQEARFKSKRAENMRTMFYTYSSFLHIATTNSTDIKVLQHLRGKRVSLGPAGSGTENLALLVMQASGMSRDDLASAENLSPAEASKALIEEKLDAYFSLGGSPTLLTDLGKTLASSDRKIVLVPIDSGSTVAQRALQKFPGILETTSLPKELYNTPGSVRGLQTGNAMVCPAEMPDDLAYELTKAVFSNLKALQNIAPNAKETSLQAAAKLVTSQFIVPMHPGAKKYLQEVKALR